MCGLVGVAGKLQYSDEFTLKRLLFFDFLRGPDSTGLAAVRSNCEDVVIAKETMNPIDFFQWEPFKAACNGYQSKAFIGHNRLKTRGENTPFNAHPYRFGHIIGCHNGTLEYESVRELEKAIGNDEKFVVDSRALYRAFEVIGPEAAIKLCTEGRDSKEGAWALVWYDTQKKTLNFLRNKHRELSFCYDKEFTRIFWASEEWMLREAIKASPNKCDLYEEKGKSFFEFEPDVWYEFDLLELTKGSKKRPKPKARPLKGKEPRTVVGFTHGQKDPFDREQKERWYKPKDPTSGTPGTTATKTNSNQRTGCSHPTTPVTTTYRRSDDDKKKMVVQLIGDDAHPYANIISEEHFARNFAHNCQWCKAPVKWGDKGLSIYEKDGRILCSKCSHNKTDDPNPATRIYVPGVVIDAFA